MNEFPGHVRERRFTWVSKESAARFPPSARFGSSIRIPSSLAPSCIGFSFVAETAALPSRLIWARQVRRRSLGGQASAPRGKLFVRKRTASLFEARIVPARMEISSESLAG
jgi:hypothetical protein